MTDHLHRLNRALPVVDLGAGRGRHALFLARAGFAVEAVDPSRTAVATVAGLAATAGLQVTTHLGTFEDFQPGRLPCAGILAFGLLPILDWASIGRLADRVAAWSRGRFSSSSRTIRWNTIVKAWAPSITTGTARCTGTPSSRPSCGGSGGPGF